MAAVGCIAAVLGSLVGAPQLALLGFLTLSAGVVFMITHDWSLRQSAIDRLQRLPFRVVHDRSDVLDASLGPRPLLGVRFVLRRPGCVEMPMRPHSLVELAELLATWGVAVHERYGVAEVVVAWGTRPGPPASL